MQKAARIFGERTQHFPSANRIAFPGRRITGPILAPLPESPTPAVYPHHGRQRIQLPTPEDNGPSIVEGTFEGITDALKLIDCTCNTHTSTHV